MDQRLQFLSSYQKEEMSVADPNMAAFCSCCGAQITLKPQACPVCGTPRHGMSQPDTETDPQEMGEA